MNLILDTDFKHMLKNQFDDKGDLRLFSIVIFVVESDSGVKWFLEKGAKKGILRPKNDLKMQLLSFKPAWLCS